MLYNVFFRHWINSLVLSSNTLHSTVMCSLLYHEVFNHYLCNGSHIYIHLFIGRQ